MLHGIIFDLDGVLIDSEPVNIQAGQRAFAEFGYTLSEKDLKQIPGRHSADYAPLIIQNNHLTLLPEQVATRCHELYQTLWEQMVVIMPEAQSTLTQLKEKDLTLALATSSSRSTVAIFIRKFGLEGIFSAIISADDVQFRKPNPEPYLKASAALNLPPDELLVVEDTAIGVAAAQAAGLRCVVIPNKHAGAQDFSPANYVLSSLREVVGLVEQLG
jgi:HAD superfamily hydrolase (TIGR01509 family)